MTWDGLLMALIKAFAVGGMICVIGQLLFDVANLTPAVSMSILVTAGSVLGALGIYDKLVDFAGFGAALPIVSFGNTLVQGAIAGARAEGFIGLLTGMLGPVSLGMAMAVAAGFLVAVVFKPKG